MFPAGRIHFRAVKNSIITEYYIFHCPVLNSLGTIYNVYRVAVFRLVFIIINCLRYIQSFFLGGEECACCGKATFFIPLCRDCLKDFTYRSPSNPKCKICGKPLISEIDVCTGCRTTPVINSLDGVFALHTYRLWKKNLLFSWKTEEKRVLSPVFARAVWNKLSQLQEQNGISEPVIIPIPPRPGKIKKKGWDQIEELCFYLKNLYGVKVCPVLKRLSVKQQKKLNRLHRMEQAKMSYSMEKERIVRRYFKQIPETVFLLDDVMTTGSTLEACAQSLKAYGIKTVYAITLFIVD
ncbi:MAG TPA: hypothetical protein DCF70_04145 [Treponema sp.]|nr:hypothetical protein [Treponema sp.]